MQQRGPQSNEVAVCNLLRREIRLNTFRRRGVGHGQRVQLHIMTTCSDDALIHWTTHSQRTAGEE